MKEKSLLFQQKFSGFFWTQFFGAFNDNAFKQAIVFMITFKMTQTLSKDLADMYVSLGAGFFILPYVLFSTYAATWADRRGKTSVIVAAKVWEIMVMSLGFVAFFLLDPKNPQPIIHLLLFTLFLMGTQSTFFSPAKYGIMPEILRDEELTEGNGLLEMGTFVSILIGSFAGGLLVEWFYDQPYVMSIFFIAIALSGWVTSLKVPKVKPVNPGLKYRIFFPAQIMADWKTMRKNRVVFLTILGISFFWFLGAIFLQILPGYGTFVGASSLQANVLLAVFSIGIGVGSMLCDRLSDGKVEMGLIPFGAIGMALFSFLFGYIYPTQVLGWGDLILPYLFLVGIGMFSGFFIVPLNALLQQRPADHERASMIALNNIINAVFMVGATGYVIALRGHFKFNEAEIVQTIGYMVIVASIYICYLLPEIFVRFMLWLLTNFFYKIKTINRLSIPLKGPVLIVANHVSYLDAFFVQMATHRPVRFIMYKGIYEAPSLNWLFRLMGTIPIDQGVKNREGIQEAFSRIKDVLDQDEVVCIFPEGQISRSGELNKFQSGMKRILKNTPCPVIPIGLGGVWGSIFSFEGGKVFWKWPKQLPYPVTVNVGDAMPPEVTPEEARSEVERLLEGCV